MNGIEATKEIRKTQSIKDIPIIAVTASALDGDQERFIKAGMDAYLAKPIDSKELHFTLCKFLTKAKKGKANA
jgi:CheY-like chemotaxis protein